MSLVVVKPSLAEVTVGQRLLQEVPAIQLMPRVLDLSRKISQDSESYWMVDIIKRVIQTLFIGRL